MTDEPQLPDWIAVDWGTSQLRIWVMAGTRVLSEVVSEEGMGRLSPEAFEPTLLKEIEPWLLEQSTPLPVIACGMVGARGGWQEAPYREVPCTPVAPALTFRAQVQDPRIVVDIVPGLCQSSPANVMRGEETQVAGVLATEPEFCGTLITPGTHSKHIHISNGVISNFETWMTGEIFALLSERSTISHALYEPGWDDVAFADGVRKGLAGDGYANVFAVRADWLLHNETPARSRARLSGLLIGSELATLGSNETCAVIGEERLAKLYQQALELSGNAARVIDGRSLVLEGLKAARGRMKT